MHAGGTDPGCAGKANNGVYSIQEDARWFRFLVLLGSVLISALVLYGAPGDDSGKLHDELSRLRAETRLLRGERSGSAAERLDHLPEQKSARATASCEPMHASRCGRRDEHRVEFDILDGPWDHPATDRVSAGISRSRTFPRAARRPPGIVAEKYCCRTVVFSIDALRRITDSPDPRATQ